MPSDSSPFRIQIETFQQLLEHENEILSRIETIPNGGHLFLVNPFMLLEDIGVAISEPTKQEIIRLEPTLATVSPLPYRTLKQSGRASRLRVRLHGLFQRRQP